MKSKNLNKTSKISENMTHKDMGFSDWQIQIANNWELK